MHTIGFQWLKFSYREDGINLHRMVDILKYLSQYYVPVFFFIIAIGQICTALKILSSFYGIVLWAFKIWGEKQWNKKSVQSNLDYPDLNYLDF